MDAAVVADSSTALRVTLLGTGSPRPNLDRFQPAALVQWGEHGHLLVDCGDGVTEQLLRAGVDPGTVEHVGFTHLHWDHVLGYPSFVWGSWNLGRRRLRVWGPTGTADMHERLVRSFYDDQADWAIDLGFAPEGWRDVEVVDLEAPASFELDGCRIEVGTVVHPPMVSFGYRFTYDGRTLVLSGDSAACDELVELARGADLFVVDGCAADPPPGAPAERQALIARLRRYHASPAEALAMGRAAGAGRTVLTHLLPGVTVVDGEVGEDLATYVA